MHRNLNIKVTISSLNFALPCLLPDPRNWYGTACWCCWQAYFPSLSINYLPVSLLFYSFSTSCLSWKCFFVDQNKTSWCSVFYYACSCPARGYSQSLKTMSVIFLTLKPPRSQSDWDHSLEVWANLGIIYCESKILSLGGPDTLSQYLMEVWSVITFGPALFLKSVI